MNNRTDTQTVEGPTASAAVQPEAGIEDPTPPGKAAPALLFGMILLALVLVISGCATRPGAEVLQTTEGTVPGAQVVTVYAATTREREAPNSNVFTTGPVSYTHLTLPTICSV